VDQSWVRQWIDDYADAWRSGDADELSALFSEDAVYRTSPFRPPTVGAAAIRDYWNGATSTQEDLSLRFGEPVVQNNKVAVEWWATMRDEGRDVTLPGCLLLRFGTDGRCEELREYWHLEGGRTEPPDGWGL
jgi:ketosteroid isomerase-like protein